MVDQFSGAKIINCCSGFENIGRLNGDDNSDLGYTSQSSFDSIVTVYPKALDTGFTGENDQVTDDQTSGTVALILKDLVGKDSNPINKIHFSPYFSLHTQFVGEQTSGYKNNFVKVELCSINIPKYFDSLDIFQPNITGCLTIEGLTKKDPLITTYFDGYIVDGRQFGIYSSTWPSSSYFNSYKVCDKIDLIHWARFQYGIVSFFQDPTFDSSTFNGLVNGRHVCMKWKERFLYSDLQKEKLEGASYEGFYYVVMDIVTGNIEGFYYHENSQTFQKLILHHNLDSHISRNDCYELS